MSPFFQTGYARIIIATALLCAGVASGVYIGDAMVHRRYLPRISGPETLAPTLAMGELFPLLSFATAQGDSGTFEKLLMGKRSVIIFLSAQCDQCEGLLSSWNTQIAPTLDTAVQTIVCFRTAEIPSHVKRLLGRKAVVIPEQRLYQLVGLKVSPTIIGVDKYGLVIYIQAGFSDAFGKDLYERFVMRAE